MCDPCMDYSSLSPSLLLFNDSFYLIGKKVELKERLLNIIFSAHILCLNKIKMQIMANKLKIKEKIVVEKFMLRHWFVIKSKAYVIHVG